MKVIKEIAIILAACLVGMLLCAIALYNYLPSRKEVPEVATYEPSKSVQESLSDDIDTKSENVILTFEQGQYEVTSKDLNNYENKNIYVPGKSNPFAAVSSDINGSANINKTDADNTIKSGTNKNGNKSSSSKSSNSGSEYIRDKGTK